MDRDIDAAVSGMVGEVALPRANGELLFEAPWEARAFGVAVALHQQGAFEWKAFSEALALEITAAEERGEASGYYERWLRALRRVATGTELLTDEEIRTKSDAVVVETEHDHPHHHHH